MPTTLAPCPPWRHAKARKYDTVICNSTGTQALFQYLRRGNVMTSISSNMGLVRPHPCYGQPCDSVSHVPIVGRGPAAKPWDYVASPAVVLLDVTKHTRSGRTGHCLPLSRLVLMSGVLTALAWWCFSHTWRSCPSLY